LADTPRKNANQSVVNQGVEDTNNNFYIMIL